MYKSPLYRFWDWLCMVSEFMARIFTGSAIMALPLWLAVNKVLWEANLPILGFWWYWFFFFVVFVLKCVFFR